MAKIVPNPLEIMAPFFGIKKSLDRVFSQEGGARILVTEPRLPDVGGNLQIASIQATPIPRFPPPPPPCQGSQRRTVDESNKIKMADLTVE